MVINAASAEVSFTATAALANPALFNLFGDGGRLAGTPEPKGVIAGSFATPPYFIPYNGSTFAEGPKFIHNNTNFGGSAGTMETEIEQLVQKMRPGAPAGVLRYGPEFYALDVTAGSGTAASISVADTPGAKVCKQIERFSSSLQERR